MASSLSLQWSVKEPEGLATIVNGDLYFLPNSTRALKTIPTPPPTWRFVERVSTVAEFQEARWWTTGTEWLGFVPRQPVPYAGVWFGPLGIIPNKLLCENQVEYRLPAFYSDKWLEVDYMLWETCGILRDSYGLKYTLPFPPRRWHYHKTFQSWAVTMEHITKGRDWFAMWIGLLYWSTQKIPNGPDFAEGLTPPDWFKTVVFKRSNKVNATYVDAIRTSQLLQNWWQIDWVGLLLHHPANAPGQPTAQWFVEQNVPVWYRWGDRECRSSKFADFSLITPSPEYFQKATTWISLSPSTYEVYQPQGSFGGYSDDGQGLDNSFDFPRASPPPIAVENPRYPLTSSAPPPDASLNDGGSTAGHPKQRVWFNKHGDPVLDYGLGQAVWEPFFKKQEERHHRKLEKETAKQKQARLSRARQPLRTSCPVFVWDWNDDEPPKFVRTRVRNDEREYTLNSYSDKQKKYNAFDNEWDCCREWGEDPDEEDYVEPLPPHLQQPKTPEELMAERLGTEVGRLLYEYYSWVAPLPLPEPEPHTSWLPEENRKSMKAVLGLQVVQIESCFFHSPLAKAAMSYIRVLATKETVWPSGDIWDLSEENCLTLVYCQTLNCIRTIKRGEETWYMFNFDNCRTVPWNIAVPTAASALMVCRLKERLDDASNNRLDKSAVVRDLVGEGVHFHTVHCCVDLGEVDPEVPSCTYVPMRLSDHVFTKEGLQFYRDQCHQIMSSPRARVALMRGGFIRRVALQFMDPSEALRGPCGTYDNPSYMFVAKDVNGMEYVDDKLSNDEYDMLVGLYLKFTGDHLHIAKVLWFPQCWVFEGSGMDVGRWTEQAERFWEKRTEAILNDKVNNNLSVPLNVTEWQSKLWGLADARRAWSKVEKWSKDYLLEHISSI